MKRLAVAAALAAIVSAAIPAAAEAGPARKPCCAAGTRGSSGARPAPKTINCAVSTKLNCRPFWLP